MFSITDDIMVYFTNPAKNMLLGFEVQETIMVDEDMEPSGSASIFSIGGFFFRIDIYFNVTDKNEVI